jgi:hypothetical protein
MPPKIKVADQPSEPVMAADGHIKVAAEPDPVPADDALPQGWHDMEDAPKDGTMIEFRFSFDQDGSRHGQRFARWKNTRIRQDRRWVPTGWWTDVITGSQIIDSSMMMWRMPEGFNMPGMVA